MANDFTKNERIASRQPTTGRRRTRLRNPAELLVLGVNPSKPNPAELLVLGTNPDGDQTEKAADLYREFHGKDPTQIVELQRSDRMRKDYTGLADLDALVFADGFDLEEYSRFREDMIRENGNFARVRKPSDCTLLNFERSDKVKVASNPDGTQLYFLGGNQDLTPCLLDMGVDPTKDMIDLGFCICIRYIASKSQSNFKPALYWHILGEDTNKPPRALYDKLKKEMFIAGGEYVVRAPGIIN